MPHVIELHVLDVAGYGRLRQLGHLFPDPAVDQGGRMPEYLSQHVERSVAQRV